jgi:hypothetical protein
LKNQPIAVFALAQAPAQAEQHGPQQRHARVAQLDRHRDALGRVAQQERESEKEDQHTHLHDGVATEDQLAHEGRQALLQARLRH